MRRESFTIARSGKWIAGREIQLISLSDHENPYRFLANAPDKPCGETPASPRKEPSPVDEYHVVDGMEAGFCDGGKKQRHIVLFRNQKKREGTMTTSEIWNATRKEQQPEREKRRKGLKVCGRSYTRICIVGTRRQEQERKRGERKVYTWRTITTGNGDQGYETWG